MKKTDLTFKQYIHDLIVYGMVVNLSQKKRSKAIIVSSTVKYYLPKKTLYGVDVIVDHSKGKCFYLYVEPSV